MPMRTNELIPETFVQRQLVSEAYHSGKVDASILKHGVAYVYDGIVLDASKMVVIYPPRPLCSRCKVNLCIPHSDYCSYSCFAAVEGKI